jgi:hypothetical protein
VATLGWLRGEELLDFVDGGFVGGEALGEDAVGDAGPEEGAGDGLHAGVLGVERSDGDRGALGGAELEVHEPAGEQEDVALVQVRREQLVARVHEAHVERALLHVERLAGARVRVRRDERVRGHIEAHQRHAHRVERRVAHARERRRQPQPVRHDAALLEPPEGEVFARHIRSVAARQPVELQPATRQIRDAEIVDRIWVRRHHPFHHHHHHQSHHSHLQRPQSIHLHHQSIDRSTLSDQSEFGRLLQQILVCSA